MYNPNLSRECIRDTLLCKRNGAYQTTTLAYALYNRNVEILCKGQLAPHREKKMTPGRILAMQQRKRFPQVIIFVRGGRVEEVYSSNPDICVDVADYDFDYDDPDRDAGLRKLEERAQQPDMHLIYE